MAAGVWAIAYAIDEADREAYLAWFHGVHIPEKLARPGYGWAGHYRESGGRYLALFGGADVRTFLDPTPGQLKGRQDELTRRMVGCRREVSAWVLAEVAHAGRVDAAPAAARLSVHAPEDLDASVVELAQSRLAAAAGGGTCFLVPVLGRGRHALLEFLDQAEPAAAADVYAFSGRRIDR